jgi:hypothetical protein
MEKGLCLHLAFHYQQINHNHNNDSIRIEVQLEKKKVLKIIYINLILIRKTLKLRYFCYCRQEYTFSTDIVTDYIEPTN